MWFFFSPYQIELQRNISCRTTVIKENLASQGTNLVFIEEKERGFGGSTFLRSLGYRGRLEITVIYLKSRSYYLDWAECIVHIWEKLHFKHTPGALVSSSLIVSVTLLSVVNRLVTLLRKPLLDGSVVDVLVAFPSSSKSYGNRRGAVSPGW